MSRCLSPADRGVLGPYLFALRASNPEGYTWNGALFSLTTLNNKPCALAPVATPVGVLFLRMYVLIMRAIKPPLIFFSRNSVYYRGRSEF